MFAPNSRFALTLAMVVGFAAAFLVSMTTAWNNFFAILTIWKNAIL